MCVSFLFVNSVEPSSVSMKARAYHFNMTSSAFTCAYCSNMVSFASIGRWEN